MPADFTHLRPAQPPIKGEFRPDLGITLEVFFHHTREGTRRATWALFDTFGNEINLDQEKHQKVAFLIVDLMDEVFPFV